MSIKNYVRFFRTIAFLAATLCFITVLQPSAEALPRSSASVAAGAVSGVSAALSSPAAGGSGVIFTVQFTTSATGVLRANAGTVTVSAPGAKLPDCADLTDLTDGASSLACTAGGLPPGPEMTLGVRQDIAGGHRVQVVFRDATNPAAAGSHALTVSTSSDTAASTSYTTVAAGAVSGVSAALSSPAAGGSGVIFTVQFTTSATGVLRANAGTVTVSAPGAKLPDCADLTDLTDGASSLACTACGLPPGPEMTLGVRQDIAGGHRVQVVFRDATNPAAAGSHALTVSTSSDTAASTSYTTLAAGAVSGVSAGLSSPAGVATVIFTVQFTTSATGVLRANAGTVTVSAPGAKLPDCADLTDLTDGASSLACTAGGLPPGPEMTLGVRQDIAGGHRVQVVFRDATNPAAAGSHALTVSTSSDTAASTSYTTLAAGAVSGEVVNTKGQSIPAAEVQACSTSPDVCFQGSTDEAGRFLIPVEVNRAYHVTARGFAAPGEPLATASLADTVEVPTVTVVTGLRLTLNVFPVPAGATVAGYTTGIPSVGLGAPIPVTIHGCPGGIAAAVLVSTDNPEEQGVATELVETPAGSGTYTGSLPPQSAIHGAAQIRANIYCFKALLPKAGPSAGGARVGINGTGFSGAKQVLFGATPAISFRVISDSLIIAVAPPGSGTVAVRVTGLSGTSAVTDAGRYAYYSLKSINPAASSPGGRTRVVIRGEGLRNVDLVIFGDKPATRMEIISDNEIDALSPPGTGNIRVFGYAIGMSPDDAATAGLPFSYRNGSTTSSMTPTAPRQSAIETADVKDLKKTTVAANRDRVASPSLAMAAQGARPLQPGTFPELKPWVPIGDTLLIFTGLIGLSGTLIWWANTVALSGTFLVPILAAPLGAAVLVAGVAVAALAVGVGLALIASIWEDPSGTVLDTNGNPVSDARVTLLRSPTPVGPFSALPPDSPLIQPNVNPQTSDESGVFRWDVLSGYYKVTASAPGCTVPGSDQATATTPVLPVPPPQIGLTLTLACPSEKPPPTPTVASISPRIGSFKGGTALTINGTGFSPAATVKIGDTPATSVTFLSPHVLSAIAPPGAGTVAVRVTTSGGTSAASAAGQYTYGKPPAITAVSPGAGSAAGGQQVRITGTGMSNVTAVRFGANTVPSWNVTSDTEITVTTPPGRPGGVNVVLKSLWGTSAVTQVARFTYLANKPGVPVNVHVTPGDRRITVSWAAPADNGGAAVDSYRVTAARVGGGAPVIRDSASSPLGLTGLTNGASYDVTVAAHNAAGWGSPSRPTRVTLNASAAVPAYPLVRRGDVSLSGVRTIQFLLRSNPSPRFAIAADGVFGARTEAAVRLFQKVNNLVVDGIAGQVTWRKLVVTQRYGNHGEQVRAIQALLNIYGRAHVGYRLAEDGIFGPLTRAAVIRFQRAAGITDDGVVGPGTWPFLVREAMRAEAGH